MVWLLHITIITGKEKPYMWNDWNQFGVKKTKTKKTKDHNTDSCKYTPNKGSLRLDEGLIIGLDLAGLRSKHTGSCFTNCNALSLTLLKGFTSRTRISNTRSTLLIYGMFNLHHLELDQGCKSVMFTVDYDYVGVNKSLLGQKKKSVLRSKMSISTHLIRTIIILLMSQPKMTKRN